MEFIAIALVIFVLIIVQKYIFDRLSFRKFDYQCHFTESEVSEGAQVGLVETVENKKWLPLPWLKSELSTSKWLEYADSQSAINGETRYVPSFFVLKSFQRITRNWHVSCQKRGVFTIQRVDLVSTDLLGFSSVSKTAKVFAELTVLPKTWGETDSVPIPRYLNGETLVRKQLIDDPFFFAGVREYTGHEPMNRICWPATAKEGKLMVFTKHYTAQRSVAVFINAQPRPQEQLSELLQSEQVEDCIRFCCLLLEQSVSEQTPIQILSNGLDARSGLAVSSPVSVGEEHVLEQKRTLARLQLKSEQPFMQFLREKLPQIESANEIVLLSAYLDEEMRSFAKEQFRRGITVKIYVAGPLSQADYSEEYLLCSLYDPQPEVPYES